MKIAMLIARILLFFSIILPCYSNDDINRSSEWIDTAGQPINAHGGEIIKVNNIYYWLGEYRSGGRSNTGKVSIYSSINLKRWKFEGFALDLSGMVRLHAEERPKVIYNSRTHKFVMWFHEELDGHYSTGKAGVAISDSIIGPYKYIGDMYPNPDVKPILNDYHKTSTGNYEGEYMKADQSYYKYLSRGNMFRDMNLFKDDDGVAYVIYESEDNYSLQVAELNSEYTGFTGKYSRVLIGLRNEAPAIFKRDGFYYLITSGLHGFDPTAARSARAKNIFGPWTILGNPVRSINAQDKNDTFGTQGTSVFEKDGKYIFMTDVWDKNNLVKSTYKWFYIDWQGIYPTISRGNLYEAK